MKYPASVKRPLVLITCAYAAGIFAGSNIAVPFIVLGIAAVIFFLGCSVFINTESVFDPLVLLLVCVTGILAGRIISLEPNCHISKVITKGHSPYLLKGIVGSDPLFEKNKTVFVLETQVLNCRQKGYACCGKVLVQAKGQKCLEYGQELILCGDLVLPRDQQGQGRRSYRQYLRGQGIYYIFKVKPDTEIVVTRQKKSLFLFIRKKIFAFKKNAEDIFAQHTSALTAAFLEAMILGEKRSVPRFVSDAMMRSGTIHILVVSGFNVGIVCMLLILLLRILRVGRIPRIVLCIPLVLAYCAVTGASTPVVRATVMAIVFMLAYVFKREPDIYNSLSIAALFILAINPRQLFDIGFQLSFISVWAIVFLSPRVNLFLHVESIKQQFLRGLAQAATVSFSAWIGTMGIIFYNFRTFSPVTVLANIFIVPLASLLTLCGFSFTLTEPLCPALTPLFANCTEVIVFLMVKINAFLVRLPGAYFRF